MLHISNISKSFGGIKALNKVSLHIERNKILIFLIDSLEKNPHKTYLTLENELIDFNPDILIKPKIICKTKSDLNIEPNKEWGKIKNVISISSVNGDGIDTLIKEITKLL